MLWLMYRLESPASHKKTVEWYEEDIMTKPSLNEYASAEVGVFHSRICEAIDVGEALKGSHEEIVYSSL